jgi:hypothetical protein
MHTYIYTLKYTTQRTWVHHRERRKAAMAVVRGSVEGSGGGGRAAAVGLIEWWCVIRSVNQPSFLIGRSFILIIWGLAGQSTTPTAEKMGRLTDCIRRNQANVGASTTPPCNDPNHPIHPTKRAGGLCPITPQKIPPLFPCSPHERRCRRCCQRGPKGGGIVGT